MKHKLAILALMVLILKYMDPAMVIAATGLARVTLSATISPTSRLTVNDSTVDPTKVGAGAIARVSAGSTPATLTVAASEDLMTGTDINPVATVTATVTGPSSNTFIAAPAALYKTAPGTASGQGCFVSYSETFNWYTAKSWSCDTGKHTVTVIYTLASP